MAGIDKIALISWRADYRWRGGGGSTMAVRSSWPNRPLFPTSLGRAWPLPCPSSSPALPERLLWSTSQFILVYTYIVLMGWDVR